MLEEVTNLEIVTLPSLTKSIVPGLIRISEKGLSNARTVSNVLAGAHDMFICVRNLSASLRLNAILLKNAVQFTENTLSFVTVLLSMKEVSVAMKKSAETMRNEAKLWKTKAAMICDATSFVECVSSANVVLNKGHHQSPKDIHAEEMEPEDFLQSAKDLQQEQGSVELQESVTSVPPDNFQTASNLSLARPLGPSGSRSIDEEESENITELGNFEEQSVRRSLRNRSMVDTLVYWPKFKKQPPAYGKVSISKSNPSTSPFTSPQALDRLLLRRDIETESDKGSNEKWAIVMKRKSTADHGSRKKKAEVQSQSGVSPQPMDCTPTQNDCSTTEDGVEEDESKIKKIEDFKDLISEKFPKTIKKNIDQNDEVESISIKRSNSEGYHTDTENNSNVKEELSSTKSRTCKICGKTLKCNRNLQAHMNMHTGSSPYQCHFCPKLFTSSWNRIQHERVHTGLKPYKCNLCEESFRYNVSLRHHKSKVHHVE